MTKKRMIVTFVAVASIALLWSFQAGAYGLFSADPPEGGNCSQCHTEWPGAEHSFHSGAFSCDTCHGDFSNPVPVSSCAGCHDTAEMFALHGGTETPSGEYCGNCHQGVSVQCQTWTDLHQLFD